MRTALINLVALVGALTIAIAIMPWGEASTTTEEGKDSALPAQHYRRIASASPVADELLLELCEPDRIVAFTGYNQREGFRNYRYQGKGTIEIGCYLS